MGHAHTHLNRVGGLCAVGQGGGRGASQPHLFVEGEAAISQPCGDTEPIRMTNTATRASKTPS